MLSPVTPNWDFISIIFVASLFTYVVTSTSEYTLSSSDEQEYIPSKTVLRTNSNLFFLIKKAIF